MSNPSLSDERPSANPAAVALGKLGGKARAKKLSKERRSEIARLAIQTRWKKFKEKQT